MRDAANDLADTHYNVLRRYELIPIAIQEKDALNC